MFLDPSALKASVKSASQSNLIELRSQLTVVTSHPVDVFFGPEALKRGVDSSRLHRQQLCWSKGTHVEREGSQTLVAIQLDQSLGVENIGSLTLSTGCQVSSCNDSLSLPAVIAVLLLVIDVVPADVASVMAARRAVDHPRRI